jgi:hypothetical protein
MAELLCVDRQVNILKKPAVASRKEPTAVTPTRLTLRSR